MVELGSSAPQPNHLLLKNIRVGYGSKQVLYIENVIFNSHKVTGILGPSGGGKSSLLHVLSGHSQHNPSLWCDGEAIFDGEDVLSHSDTNQTKDKLALLQQRSRFYGGLVYECLLDGVIDVKTITTDTAIQYCRSLATTLGLWQLFKPVISSPIVEQSLGFHKLVLIAKLMAGNPLFVLLDEPYRDFALVEEPLLTKLINKINQTAGVLLITHNKNHARAVCDEVALLSGGRLIEHSSCNKFFNNPDEIISKEFLISGSAWPTSDEVAENDQIISRSKANELKKQFPNLNSFYWIIPGMIGGAQRPGLLTDEAEDIRKLNLISVDFLVSLTQKPIVLSKHKNSTITGLHFPINDMKAPDLDKTYAFLKDLLPKLQAGKSAVFHCKAGIGRTGTMLACCLVMLGKTASQSIGVVRNIFFRYIQSEEQSQFVIDFAEFVTLKQRG